MISSFIPILVLFVFAGLFAGAFLGISAILGPKKKSHAGDSIYECGAAPVGGARERFSVKFFLVAILFILFDIEVVFLFPWAVLFRQFVNEGMGLFVFVEMAVFLVILVLGYIFVWRKGALDWR